jgi:hypothetical protein
MSKVMVRYTVKPDRAQSDVKAFAEFQKDVRERCVEPPVVSELHEVGSFEFW